MTKQPPFEREFLDLATSLGVLDREMRGRNVTDHGSMDLDTVREEMVACIDRHIQAWIEKCARWERGDLTEKERDYA